MVRERTEHGQAEQPDTIDRECVITQDAGGYLIMIPGECDTIAEARGRAIAVGPSDVADLEANR